MNTQVRIDDLTLSAWLDDELDAAQSKAVQSALEAQPDLQQRLARLVVNDRRLREHYEEMARQRPVPEALQALLGDNQAARRPWFLRLSDWTVQNLPRPALATAALALALLVGVQFGEQRLVQGVSASPLEALTSINQDHAWFELLERTPAGQTLSFSNTQSGQVDFSFRDEDENWCRQFEVRAQAAGEALVAVACRRSNQWQRGVAQIVRLSTPQPDVYRAASGDEAAAVDTFIMSRLSGGLVLGEEEAAFIEQRWP